MERLAAGGVAGLLLPHAAVMHVDLERIHLLLVLSAQHLGRHDRAPRLRLALRVAMGRAHGVRGAHPEDGDDQCRGRGVATRRLCAERRPVVGAAGGRARFPRCPLPLRDQSRGRGHENV